MKAQFVFPNVDFLQSTGQRVRVKLNEEFVIFLQNDNIQSPMPEVGGWFADSDEVLEMTAGNNGSEGPTSMHIKAAATGTSELQIQGPRVEGQPGRTSIMYLIIEVYSPEAQSMSINSGAPVQK